MSNLLKLVENIKKHQLDFVADINYEIQEEDLFISNTSRTALSMAKIYWIAKEIKKLNLVSHIIIKNDKIAIQVWQHRH